ncbi:hypothetical protein B8W69_06645 [Mycobacterium vulneris]|uniref:Uncharacterized protein n=1 Tax=Mycolicibacterium vulneris TaxID=547163 RepID=A0A1X2L9M3_9MYCO|nr:hypothetical protein [Mycolicibacterium vulneris]OSC30709.1 hypothetical protein B8W69_06645 [Mycolicibacterium vulneris]
MKGFVCMMCDWAGTPEPFLVPSGGAGGIEFMRLQRGGIKPLRYALEVVMDDGTKLVRVGNFETRGEAAGLGIFFHNPFVGGGSFHCRVRPVRDYFAADDTDPNLCVGSNEKFVPAE